MKTFIAIPFILLLTGCPGGKPGPHTKSTFIEGNHLCFSLDKKDVLSYYRIESSENLDNSVVEYNEGLHQSYPDDCIIFKWHYGYSYTLSYGLNGNDYVHEFFIDKNGRLTHLGGL